jgi:superfamily II DNA/RNA helicase
MLGLRVVRRGLDGRAASRAWRAMSVLSSEGIAGMGAAAEASSSDTAFADLSADTQRNLEKMGIKELFPVQASTFGTIAGGVDMVGRSRTGSGKTLAFVLPIVEQLCSADDNGSRGRPSPRCVVLAPTRELAVQVSQEFSRVAGRRLNVSCIYGGVPIDKQLRELRNGTDVIVGTPGRVRDHINRGTLRLDEVQFAVLDEADEMLGMGFKDDVMDIIDDMPAHPTRQTLMWSATFDKQIRSLSKEIAHEPTFVDMVGDDDGVAFKLPESVTHISVPTMRKTRFDVLNLILERQREQGRVLVFTRTKAMAGEISMADEVRADCHALHGDMSQAMRSQTLDGFRRKDFDVLIATDVAARGLDIPEVDTVVHMGLPESVQSFVHRSGRTGRAYRDGTNIVLTMGAACDDMMRDVERKTNAQFITGMRFSPTDMVDSAVPAVVERVGGVSPVVRCHERVLLFTVTFHANRAHNLTRSP